MQKFRRENRVLREVKDRKFKTDGPNKLWVADITYIPLAGRGAVAVFDFIEGRYNPRRRHSALDYQSPINYERDHDAAAAA